MAWTYLYKCKTDPQTDKSSKRSYNSSWVLSSKSQSQHRITFPTPIVLRDNHDSPLASYIPWPLHRTTILTARFPLPHPGHQTPPPLPNSILPSIVSLLLHLLLRLHFPGDTQRWPGDVRRCRRSGRTIVIVAVIVRDRGRDIILTVRVQGWNVSRGFLVKPAETARRELFSAAKIELKGTLVVPWSEGSFLSALP